MWEKSQRIRMFRGINALSLDAKGRITVPMRYRSSLIQQEGGTVVITIDTEETCLLMYPLLEWQTIETNLQKLPSFNKATRRIQRLLIGHATELEIDTNGRLLLPPLLRDYANLNKQILLVGQGNKFEIWNELAWEEKRAEWLATETSLKDDLPEEMKNFSL